VTKGDQSEAGKRRSDSPACSDYRRKRTDSSPGIQERAATDREQHGWDEFRSLAESVSATISWAAHPARFRQEHLIRNRLLPPTALFDEA
jgi:hypothetical protein